MTGSLPPMPCLAAGRYLLRAWTDADAPAVVEAAGDAYIVATTTVPAGGSAADAAQFVARQRRRLEEGTGYSFAIAAADGTVAGQVGVWVRELDAGRVELGYWTLPSRRGQGVATAAVGAASAWALSTLGAARLQAYVEPWNTASVRTLQRCGYEREGLQPRWREVAGERRDFWLVSRLAG